MNRPDPPTEASFRGTVATVLPLTLLQAVRESDHPGEVLEGEDLSVSLSNRLGLTGIVETQIRRYEAADPWDPVPMAEAAGLMRLVVKRPDGEELVRETGRRVARLRFGPMPKPAAFVLRKLPRGFAFGPLRRGTRKLLRRMVGDSSFKVGKPLHLRMPDAPTARLEPPACDLYTGALEALLERYLGEPRQVVHVRCRARGDDACEWRTRGDAGTED